MRNCSRWWWVDECQRFWWNFMTFTLQENEILWSRIWAWPHSALKLIWIFPVMRNISFHFIAQWIMVKLILCPLNDVPLLLITFELIVIFNNQKLTCWTFLITSTIIWRITKSTRTLTFSFVIHSLRQTRNDKNVEKNHQEILLHTNYNKNIFLS